MLHSFKTCRLWVAAGLAALLLLAAVPAQAAPAAPAERAETASVLDGLREAAWRLVLALPGGSQLGPGIDPNGAPVAESGSGGGEGEAGPEIDPDG